jgi:tetratricopeptide (TPR) repeat protein
MKPPSRIDMLLGFIQQKPQDPFPRYALALEYKNGGRLDEARATFDALMTAHPDYTAAYLHAGNTLVALGLRDEARATYERGVEACVRRGDTHARGELEGALSSL